MSQAQQHGEVGAPQPRRIVASLPHYVAGKPAAPVHAERSYKLSSNENPFEPDPSVLAAVAEAVSFNRYPDPSVQTFRDALSEYLDVPVEDIIAAAGSLGALQQVLATFAGGEDSDEVIYAWRSFEAYPIVIGLAGALGVPIPNTAEGRHDLEAMVEALSPQTKVIILCTPNNPTGPALSHDAVEDFLARVPAHVVVCVDEAYAEFVREPHAVDGLRLYREHPNVIVLRTFSKAFGLAGLRLGYSISQPELTRYLRSAATPFAVSNVAEAAGIASLNVADRVLTNVQRIVDERTSVVARLREMGWDIPDAQGNFVWLALAQRSAQFAENAQQRGISVRAFGDEGVRVSIGEPEGNEVFLELAQEYIPS